jgi:hypothetical protein
VEFTPEKTGKFALGNAGTIGDGETDEFGNPNFIFAGPLEIDLELVDETNWILTDDQKENGISVKYVPKKSYRIGFFNFQKF